MVVKAKIPRTRAFKEFHKNKIRFNGIQEIRSRLQYYWSLKTTMLVITHRKYNVKTKKPRENPKNNNQITL